MADKIYSKTTYSLQDFAAQIGTHSCLKKTSFDGFKETLQHGRYSDFVRKRPVFMQDFLNDLGELRVRR